MLLSVLSYVMLFTLLFFDVKNNSLYFVFLYNFFSKTFSCFLFIILSLNIFILSFNFSLFYFQNCRKTQICLKIESILLKKNIIFSFIFSNLNWLKFTKNKTFVYDKWMFILAKYFFFFAEYFHCLTPVSLEQWNRTPFVHLFPVVPFANSGQPTHALSKFSSNYANAPQKPDFA